MNKHRRAFGREVLVIGAYAALTALATYPLVRQFGRSIPGGGDAWQFYWNLWWVKRAIVDLHTSPYFTPDLYFPYGASLYFHTLNLLPSALAVPIVSAFGLAAAYNTLVFVSFVLSGYSVYRLALYVLRVHGEDAWTDPLGVRLAAFAAGVMFAFSSYRFVHLLGHLDLLSTWWLPLFVLCLLKTWHEGGWRNAAAAGALLAAASATSWYYLLYLLVFTGLLVLVEPTGERTSTYAETAGRWQPSFPRAQAAGRVARAVAIFALLALPLLAPMLIRGWTEGRTPNSAYDVDRFSSDLMAFVVPSPLHSLWGETVAPLYGSLARADAGVETVSFLGYVPLVFAIIGFATCAAARRVWLVVTLVFTALALGPVLHVAGRAFLVAGLPVTWPYRALAALPYGDIPRVPSRFVVMITLCLSVAAALGAWRLLRRRPRTRASAFSAGICVLVLVENAVVPVPMAAVSMPPYYARLAADDGRRGIVEVPIPDDPASEPRRMLFQTRHGQPTFGGYVSRGLPPLRFDAIPGFSQFKTLSDLIDDVVPYDPGQLPATSRTILAACGAGHIVIEKDRMLPHDVQRARAIADALLGPASRTYEDDRTLAYGVPGDSAGAVAAIWIDSGWSYLERLPQGRPDDPWTKWRWMADHAHVRVFTPEPGRFRVTIGARSFGRARRLALAVDGRSIETLAISTDTSTHITASFSLPAGAAVISLTSLDGADRPDSPDSRRLSVALYRLELVKD